MIFLFLFFNALDLGNHFYSLVLFVDFFFSFLAEVGLHIFESDKTKKADIGSLSHERSILHQVHQVKMHSL